MQAHPLILCAAVTLAAAHAQQPMGTVATRDALVTGGLEVSGERARLLTNASITAYDRTAPVELDRGGEVLVCATSQFHLLRSGKEQSLVFGLDRGAIEVHGALQPQDLLLTPDLRFTFVTAGDANLRVRVTADGDTCVENSGASSPQLAIADAFSDAAYRLQPGQHVLFEHGSLTQVVDNERSPCGCPRPPAPPTQLAQVADGIASTPAQAEARNPFPAAVSQGLAPEAKPAGNAVAPGETKTQVSSTLAFGTNAQPAAPAPPQPAASATPASLAPPPSPPGAHDLAHAIGRFFHRLFHRDN